MKLLLSYVLWYVCTPEGVVVLDGNTIENKGSNDVTGLDRATAEHWARLPNFRSYEYRLPYALI